jgi:rubrerythrin
MVKRLAGSFRWNFSAAAIGSMQQNAALSDMAKKHWTLDDLPWDRFDPSKVDPDVAQLVRAAALVEYNAGDYAHYLCNVFRDDPEFQQVARDWAVEEVQHGAALGKWAERVDPDWKLDVAFKRFTDGYRIQLDASESIRGSLSGELIARCMVETGTSSYYAALGEATEEPVLKAICRHIAADELRHYKLFYTHLHRYLEKERLSRLTRLRIALGRVAESEDDELAYAYYAANAGADERYDHRTFNQAYVRRAYSYYRPHHLDRGMAMIFKAVGLSPQSRLLRFASKAAWWLMDSRRKKLLQQVA